tara:strand:- start:141 stop:554 length:414 start_codon:yes stop_codon:yes gene_type:complete
MSGIKLATILAGLSHISTVISAVILMFIPLFAGTEIVAQSGGLNQLSETKLTLIEMNGTGAMLTLIFPWVVTGLSVVSTIMGAPERKETKKVLWRWRSYSWGAAIVMAFFVALSFTTLGIFYIPALSLVIGAAIFNK